MVSSIGSTSTNIDQDLKKLASGFQTGIQAEIDKASAPMKRIQTQRDTVDVRRGIFADLKSNFDALQTAVRTLISSQSTYGLKFTAKPTVTPFTAGSTVFTATTTNTAALADYEIAVSKLAKAQSRSTGAYASSDAALGKTGTIWLGGNGAAALDGFSANDTVTAASVGSIATGQRELGSGAYTVQTRVSDGVRQFRLVNADGTGVSIRNATGSGYSDGWQAMVNGSYDTGRGITMDLSRTGVIANAALNYTARGVSVSINTSDTLRTIVSQINAASQPEGRDLKASIVGNKLVFTAAQSGANHAMVYTDGADLGFGVDLQIAQDAVFTVNGLEVTRSKNTNLTDVVDGATINLSGDAEGKTARLSVGGTSDAAVTAMNELVTKFNNAFSHLTQKMAISSKTEGVKTTYTRGPLTGDLFFKGLRTDMFNQMNRSYATGGTLTRLEQIGLSFDKDMKMSLDSAKFTQAMKNNFSEMTALLDTAMGGFDTLLSRQTGTSGMLQTTLTALENQVKDFDSRISKKNDSLTLFKKGLYDKYLNYQITLATIGYEAEMFGVDLTT